MNSPDKYKKEPFSAYEQSIIDTMVANGATLEAAQKVRYAERKRQKVLRIEGKSVTIKC